jgi:hypothetical protein
MNRILVKTKNFSFGFSLREHERFPALKLFFPNEKWNILLFKLKKLIKNFVIFFIFSLNLQ